MPSSRTELTTPERAALLILLAEGRALTNAELAETAGIRLTGEPRRRLNDEKLVESTKVGRTFRHEITDDGVAWCRGQLTAPTPPRAGSFGGALYALLRGLGRKGIPLAELFPVRAEPVAPAGVTEDRIRKAYRDLAPPGDYVRLVDLRARLTDVDRTAIDSALEQLAVSPGVHVEAEPDQGSLTAAERAAAVRVGGEDRHMIKIEAG